MYRWMWRRLPGPVWLKVSQSLVIALLALGALFGFVFPWFADTFLAEPSTLG